jgi:hypothetical protein
LGRDPHQAGALSGRLENSCAPVIERFDYTIELDRLLNDCLKALDLGLKI